MCCPLIVPCYSSHWWNWPRGKETSQVWLFSTRLSIVIGMIDLGYCLNCIFGATYYFQYWTWKTGINQESISYQSDQS